MWPRSQEVGHFPRCLHHSKTGMVIYHCDLGVKRSGIFLAVSIIQRQVRSLIIVTSGSRGRAFSSQSPSFKDRKGHCSMWPRGQEVGHFPRSLHYSKTSKVGSLLIVTSESRGGYFPRSLHHSKTGRVIIHCDLGSRGRTFSSQSPLFIDR